MTRIPVGVNVLGEQLLAGGEQDRLIAAIQARQRELDEQGEPNILQAVAGGFDPERLRRAGFQEDQGHFVASQGNTLAVVGTPDPNAEVERRHRQEVARHRREYQDLIAQQHRLAQRAPHMNPAVAARQKAGVEYDLSRFEATANDNFARQRNVRLAGRDLNTALSEYRKGGIDESQLSEITESMKREYGPDVLVNLPEWRQINDLEGEFQQAIESRGVARAEQLNISPEKLRWDPRAGRHELDDEAFFVERYKVEQAARVAKPINDARRAALDNVDTVAKAERDIADKQFTAMMKAKQPELAIQTYNTAIQGIEDRRRKGYASLSAAARELVAGQQETPQPTEQLTHPKLPAGTRISGAYATPADMVAARPAPGSYVVGDGKLFYINSRGRPELVE